MPGFNAVDEITRALEAGKAWTSMWRRTAPALSQYNFVDMSYGGGGPPANYYASAPGVCSRLAAVDGIYHGPDVAPARKYVKSISMSGTATSAGVAYVLLDYEMYVPFLDGDETGVQGISQLAYARHAGGNGIRLMLVGQGAGTGSAYFTITYVNQHGMERTSPRNLAGFSLAPGSVLSSYSSSAGLDDPFIKLHPGDFPSTVTGIQLESAVGGVFALVWVKPVVHIPTMYPNANSWAAGAPSYNATQTVNEIDFTLEKGFLSQVGDGAYLNFIARSTSATTPLSAAELTFVWS